MMRMTIQDRLTAADNRPSGFDYMRLILALCVVLWHTVLASYGRDFDEGIWNTPWRMLLCLVLPMFFSLSGFLVSGSLERSKTLITFLGLRVIRIVPALAGDVLLSALILGPILTSFSLSDYFSDPLFRSYFLNIVGDIHYSLPGVFLQNPASDTVNAQLWTVPYELKCYIVLSVLAVVGIFKRRDILLLTLVGMYVFQIGHIFLKPDAAASGPMGGNTMVMTFIAGVTAYKFRDLIPSSFLLFLGCTVLTLALFLVSGGDRFTAVPIAYMTIYLGVFSLPRQKLLLSGDYSYGIFLYGFPIQQTIAWFGPSMQHWYWSALIGIPVTCAVAAFSWWFIEKPALELRKQLKMLEQWACSKIPQWRKA